MPPVYEKFSLFLNLIYSLENSLKSLLRRKDCTINFSKILSVYVSILRNMNSHDCLPNYSEFWIRVKNNKGRGGGFQSSRIKSNSKYKCKQ